MRLLRAIVRAPPLWGCLIVSCKSLRIHLTDFFVYFVDVARDFNRLEDIPDDTLFVNNKRRSFWVAGRVGKHAQHGAYRAVWIGQEQRHKIVGRGKVAVRLDRIARDANGYRAELCEVSRPLTEVSCLARSAGRHVFWVCPQDDRFRASEVLEVERPILCLRNNRWQLLANLNCHILSSLTTGWNQRPDLEDLVADGDGLRLTADRHKRRTQHTAADVAVSNVDLAFVENAATHREGFTLEVFPDRVVPRHKSHPALAYEGRAKMDGDIDDFARVVHVLARLNVDTFDLHTGAGVRAGGGPTLRRMSVFHV